MEIGKCLNIFGKLDFGFVILTHHTTRWCYDKSNHTLFDAPFYCINKSNHTLFFSSLIFHLYDEIPLMRICMYEGDALKYLEWVGIQISLKLHAEHSNGLVWP